MSVIYNALKKIKKVKKPDDDEAAVSLPSSRPKGNILVFDKVLTRRVLVSAAILILVIVFMGGALVYIYQDEIIANRIVENAPGQMSSRPVTSTAPQVKGKGAPAKIPNSSPTPVGTVQPTNVDDNIVAYHIIPGQVPEEPTVLSMDVEGNDEAVSAGNDPFAVPALADFKTPTPSTKQPSEIVPVQAHLVVGLNNKPLLPSSAELTSKNKMTLALRTGNIQADSLNTTTKRQYVRPTRVGAGDLDLRTKNRDVTNESKSMAATSQPILVPGMINKDTPPPILVSAGRKECAARPPDQTMSKQQIPELNQDFQAAILNHDYTAAHGVITKLESLLGPEAMYIKKLRAFLYLQKQEPAKAKNLLSSILLEDATDLEAGINMVVVLVKEGNIKAARRRTAWLLDYYPDNRTLLYFKQQLVH